MVSHSHARNVKNMGHFSPDYHLIIYFVTHFKFLAFNKPGDVIILVSLPSNNNIFRADNVEDTIICKEFQQDRNKKKGKQKHRFRLMVTAGPLNWYQNGIKVILVYFVCKIGLSHFNNEHQWHQAEHSPLNGSEYITASDHTFTPYTNNTNTATTQHM